MLRILAWLPLFLALSTPTFAARIDVIGSSGGFGVVDLSGFGPMIVSTPNHNGLFGVTAEGVPASVGTSLFPPWFSDVRFDGTTYTYLYGITKAVSVGIEGDPNASHAYTAGEPSNRPIPSFLTGGQLDGDWGYVSGVIPEHSGFGGFYHALGPDLLAVSGGLMIPPFNTRPVAFYFRSLEAPALTGVLTTVYHVYDGRFICTPSIPGSCPPNWVPDTDITVSFDAYVPTPEPGTWLLLIAGGGVLARRLRRKTPAPSVGSQAQPSE